MAKVPKSFRLEQFLIDRIEAIVGFRDRATHGRPLREADVVQAALEHGVVVLEQATTGWRWRCDSCGERIRSVETGWLEWIRVEGRGDEHYRGLRLVHHVGRKKCQYDEDVELARDEGWLEDLPLADFVGSDGLVALLELERGKSWKDRTMVSTMIMRLHVPAYEQVYRHAAAAEGAGAFEPNAAAGVLARRDIVQIARWMLTSDSEEARKDGRRALKLLGDVEAEHDDDDDRE